MCNNFLDIICNQICHICTQWFSSPISSSINKLSTSIPLPKLTGLFLLRLVSEACQTFMSVQASTECHFLVQESALIYCVLVSLTMVKLMAAKIALSLDHLGSKFLLDPSLISLVQSIIDFDY